MERAKASEKRCNVFEELIRANANEPDYDVESCYDIDEAADGNKPAEQL